MTEKYVQKFKAKKIFHTFLSSLYSQGSVRTVCEVGVSSPAGA